MMKKIKKNIPVPEPDKDNIEYICPSASWGDMTGLIPANNSPETTSDEYEEIYPYLPKASHLPRHDELL